ncbi:hypothetical protein [Chryseobacterium indoltheticum]|uniref:hypothetical protein n=1 Tax=Chryseobacterium indoltheticum TaxID=254 RepID=UPI003F49AACD
MYLKFNTATQFAGTTKIQGSNTNNGIDWVDLSAAIAQTAGTNVTANGAVSITTSIKYPVTLNTATAYKYIRITGVAISNIAAQNSSEVYFDFNNSSYIASRYPKASCTDVNIDGDGILPHFDLDTDNDGCSDALEAGATSSTTANYQFTGAVGANGLIDSKETSTDSGIINYNSTYGSYAKDATVNACTDTDGDGIRDVIDIDDDNDGILDITEQQPETCESKFTSDHLIVQWSSVNSNTMTGSLIINGEVVNVKATTTKTFVGLGNSHFNYGTGAYAGCPEVNNTNTNSAINIQTNDYTVTYTFSKPVRNPAITMSSFNVTGGTNPGVYFPQPVYVSGVQGSIAGVAVGEYITYIPNTESKVALVYNGLYSSISFNVVGTDNLGSVMMYVQDIKDGSSSLTNTTGSPFGYSDIDTDGDLIPNRLDLDSDGDGCSDLSEANVSPLTDQITPSTTNHVGGNYGMDNPIEPN